MTNRVNGNHVEFELTANTQARCPHCTSGFAILTIGVSDDGKITNIAFCTPGKELTVPLYCPYCGKDMRQIELEDK
jgi:hypothetical protein